MNEQNLFDKEEKDILFSNSPLAVRMRPTTIEEFVGHSEVIGEGSWLKSAIEADALSSIILFGPPGSGKTSLGKLIASVSSAHLVEIPAISGGVQDLRKALESAKVLLLERSERTILFIDEIHRFSKSQQDALLGAVENRIVILIGATTENPYFEINNALLSRSKVIELKSLEVSDIEKLIRNAVQDPRGFDGKITITNEAVNIIAQSSSGDARWALNTLEAAANLSKENYIDSETLTNSAYLKSQLYDKHGDYHYDTISAFIKSMRGSDPDAAVYYLAKMLESGEDPKFIARRIMILASEDIGNADPHALLVAHAAFKSAEVIGMPECRINLSQAAIYMSLAPKSNASYLAIDAAMSDVRNNPERKVPDHLRDRHRPGSDEYPNYKYPHDYPKGWIDQQYLPDGLKKNDFYRPGERGWEARATEVLPSALPETNPKKDN